MKEFEFIATIKNIVEFEILDTYIVVYVSEELNEALADDTFTEFNQYLYNEIIEVDPTIERISYDGQQELEDGSAKLFYDIHR